MKRIMKKINKKAFSALLAFLIVAASSSAVYASTPSITFNGETVGFDFKPGSEYTATDLFESFKGVMPGDELEEFITFTNNDSKNDYVKLYMRAELHDEETNPLSEGVAAEGATVESSNDFLSQLSMKVYNGTELIYEASLDELDGLENNVLLGKINSGETANLRVVLTVPKELGNDYAYAIGEVDWVFYLEAYKDGDLIQTGQLNWPVYALGILGVVLILVGIILGSKKRRKNA